MDEESNEGRDRALSEDPSVDTDDQTKIAAGKEIGDIGNNDGNEPSVLVIDNDSTSQNPLRKLRKGGEIINDSSDLDKGTNPAEVVTYPVLSDVQVVGDASTGWKVVLHEESNQYYYWNITTGETSWEVPDDLAQVTDMSCLEKAAADTEEKSNGLGGTSGSSIPLDMEHGDSTTGQLNGGSDTNRKTGCVSEQVTKMHGYGEGCNGDSVDEKGNPDADQNNGTSLLADNSLGNEIALSSKINHGTHSEECETGTDLSSQLVKHCEILLERLNSAKGLSCHLQARDLISKYALEVEIRLADIKALTNHGSLLLPFWLHSKGQLEQLEAAVDDVITLYNSSLTSEVEGTNQSFEGIGDAVVSSEKKPLFPVVVPQASEYAAHDSYFKSYGDGPFTAGSVPSSGHLTSHSGNGSGRKSEISGLAIHSELTPKTVLHSGEVDMDVDMEVEDAVASANPPIQDASGAESHLPSEQLNLHNLLADQELSMPVQIFSVPPPPPDDDWIPPPPPDDEPFPPPPPDVEPPPPPPEASVPPPSQLEFGQPFTYTEQYNLSYPASSLEYYRQTNTELSGASLYANPEGGHIAVSHLPQYYDGVSNVYGAAPLVVNPVEPASYYGLQNGTVHPALLVSGTAVESSSGIHSETVLKSFGSETAESSNAHAETGSSFLAQTKANVLDADQVTIKVSGVPDSQHSIEAPPTASNTRSVSVSSTSSVTATIVAGATTSKVQSKVSRSKKKTAAVVSTLRSNKKVSSLVDKWKAAKEELHEEEEEPENTYEMLEKKRQREIEEWRAQQIASGEAKDNANFQPLGGDWRERVKRRRSQKIKETEKSESDVAMEGNQQPDLAALSGGLPSGWQVYWDDSSKQVYYGNTLTSETTWIRPAD